MKHRVAIIQSSYLPWIGYFHIIASVDTFVFFDDVQFTRRDWRSRNRIKTPRGLQWLSVPISKGAERGSIDRAEIVTGSWADKHQNSILQHYRHAPYFSEIAPWIGEVFAKASEMRTLGVMNRDIIESICALLGISTQFELSSHYPSSLRRTERLVDICKRLDASTYLTGPSARDYLDETKFEEAGIETWWMSYAGYPEYPQLYSPPFEGAVSTIDLLFNLGRDGAARYLQALPKR